VLIEIAGMKIFRSSQRSRAFTLVELLVVMAIIGLLAALLLPALSGGKLEAKRVLCENNLQQQGLAFQLFAHDHNSKFPMQVSADEGGAQEFVQNGYRVNGQFFFSFRIFQTLSNELVTPDLLICPADTRLPATKFSQLQNSNLSYFVNAEADYFKPASILAGDRNLASNTFSNPSILHDGDGIRLRWTQELHGFKGNVLFADGHVEKWSDLELITSASAESGDLFMPSANSNLQNSGGQPATYASAGPPPPAGNSPTPASDNSSVEPPSNSTTPPATATTRQSMPGQIMSPADGHQKLKAAVAALIEPETSNAIDENNSAVTDLEVTDNPTTNETDSGISPANQKAARYMQWALGWFFLLMLLLLLLNLWLQSRKKRTR
jgi:prepilin-type N-terminal cleavage/methylation domain-containing protein/prepilin-type processing-associated H-X9-DG protein